MRLPAQFCELIAPLRGATKLIGVDGLGASGKTTIADVIAEAVGGFVVHVDDLSAPGVEPWEYVRFSTQVWQLLAQGRPGRFQKHHWTSATPGDWVDVPTGVPVILEGVRSTSRVVGVPFDLRIWIHADEATRLARAASRAPERFECWTRNWMPIENRWFEAERPDLAADIVWDSRGCP